MASLTNTKIKDTYTGLVKTTGNTTLPTSGKTLLTDGGGNSSAMSLGRANNGVGVTGTLTASSLEVDGDTLHVDSTNNRVGIGTDTPDVTLEIDGVTRAAREGIASQYIEFKSDSSGNHITAEGDNKQFKIFNNSDTDSTILINDSLGDGIELQQGGVTKAKLDDNAAFTVLSDSEPTLQITSTKNGTWSVGESFGRLNFYGSDASGVGAGTKGFVKMLADSIYGASFDMTFGTCDGASAATERMRILANGGLTFNGDTSSLNALDDYEEGEFDPTFVGTGGTISVTYDVQQGFYTKIGNVVHCVIGLGSDAVSNASGNLEIHGLPYTVAKEDSSATIGLNYSFGQNLVSYRFSAQQNTTKILIYNSNTTSQYSAANLLTGTNSNRLRLQLTYLTT
jgi:hypothetical protein